MGMALALDLDPPAKEVASGFYFIEPADAEDAGAMRESW